MEIVKQAAATPFLVKLWSILEEDNAAMHWNVDGVTFSVKSIHDLERDILPRYFRSRQFSTFQRQLSYFGFRKQSTPHDKCRWCHELFQRNRPGDVLLIKRKVNTGNEHKKRKRREWKEAPEKRTQVPMQRAKTEPYIFPSFAKPDQNVKSLYGNMPDATSTAAASMPRPTLSMWGNLIPVWGNLVNPSIHRLATESNEKLNPSSRLSPRSESARVAFNEVTTTHTAQTQYQRPVKADVSVPRSRTMSEDLREHTNKLTPRTLSALQEMEFDKDPWLNILSPLTPAVGALPMSWSSLVSTTISSGQTERVE
jgi:hypothetical protein